MNEQTTPERQPEVVVPPILLSGSSTILRNEVLRMWNVTQPEARELWGHVDVIAERYPNDDAHVYVEADREPVILKLTPSEACGLAAGLIRGSVEASRMIHLTLPDDENPGPTAPESKVLGERPADWHPQWCDPARCKPGCHYSDVDDSGSDVDDVRVDYGISQLHDDDNLVRLPAVAVTIENTSFVDMAVTAHFTPDDAREMAVRLLQYAAAADEHADDA